MQIKVEYHKTDLDKALWSAKRKFTTDEFEPSAHPVAVSGLKPAKAAAFNWDDIMDCKKQTGLTESEYQAKHHYAWSE